MLWLAEAAIEGYFRDVLPAIPQVARGPFETHICEHFVWPDAGRSPKQASKMSRTQAHQSRNAFQRYVPGYPWLQIECSLCKDTARRRPLRVAPAGDDIRA